MFANGHSRPNFGHNRGGSTLTAIWQDLRYAVRTFRQSPGFTLAAIFALALGIGANAAIFSVVNAVLLNSKPLRALREPERLVMLWQYSPQFSVEQLFTHGLAPMAKNYVEWKKQSRSFEGLAMFDLTTFSLTAGSDASRSRPERLEGARITSDFFPLLGIQPQLGRNFTTEEMQPGKGRVVIVGDDVYRTRFHGDPNILGKSIQVNGEQYQVVGVMPPKFRLPAVWMVILSRTRKFGFP